MVIWSHSFEMLGHSTLFTHWNGQISEGGLAVDCFFILSGYLILQSREHSKDFESYFRARVLRIYPLYLVVSFVGIAIFYQWQAIPSLIPDLATLQVLGLGAFQGNKFTGWDGALWTISYEGICYIAVAILYAFGLFRDRRVTLGIFALCLIVFYNHHTTQDWQNPVRFWVLFAAGCVMYQYRDIFERMNSTVAISAMSALLCAGQYGHNLLLLSIPLLLPFCLYWLAFKAPLASWTKDDLSYGTYAWGWPVMSFWIWMSGSTIAPLLEFAISMLCLVPISILSWRYIEKPCLSLKALWYETSADRPSHLAPESVEQSPEAAFPRTEIVESLVSLR